MKLAEGLAWVNTRLLLGVVFFLAMTPLGLFLQKILGKDLLKERPDPQTQSYWQKRSQEDRSPEKSRYQRMF
jgi:hypothetical protein